MAFPGFFPALGSGAVCQFPVGKTVSYRTIVNLLEDGSRITLEDPNASTVQWDLRYSGVTDAELMALRAFFESMEGRLNTFSFIDPSGNLLVWSETLSSAAWQKSTLLTAQPGIGDPVGSQRAWRISNTTQAPLALVQTVGVPAALPCCWSAYLRGGSGVSVTFTRDGASETYAVDSSWRRYATTARSAQTADTSDFGLIIPAGGSVDLFGLQVEPELAPSGYVPTLNTNALYPATRFDSDTLDAQADAPNSNSCRIRLYSRTT